MKRTLFGLLLFIGLWVAIDVCSSAAYNWLVWGHNGPSPEVMPHTTTRTYFSLRLIDTGLFGGAGILLAYFFKDRAAPVLAALALGVVYVLSEQLTGGIVGRYWVDHPTEIDRLLFALGYVVPMTAPVLAATLTILARTHPTVEHGPNQSLERTRGS